MAAEATQAPAERVAEVEVGDGGAILMRSAATGDVVFTGLSSLDARLMAEQLGWAANAAEQAREF